MSVSWEGKRIQKSTGISVKPNFWNKNNQTFRANYPNALQLNQVLHNLRDSIEKYYYSAKSNSKAVRKEEMQKIITSILKPAEVLHDEKAKPKPKPKEKYLIDYFDEFIILKRSSKAYSENTIKKYITCKMHLLDYQRSKRIKLKFEDMNKHFSDNFFAYMIQKKKLLNSSAAKILKVIKTFLYYAQEMKWTDNNDFAKGFSKTLSLWSFTIFSSSSLLRAFVFPTESV